MDAPFYVQVIRAVLRELNRHKTLVMAAFIIISFAVLLAGYLFPKKYVTSSQLYADETNIIEPLLQGRAVSSEIDRSEKAREVLYTRRIMEQIANQAGLIKPDDLPEVVDAAIKRLRARTTIVSESKNFFRITYVDTDPDASFNVHNTIVNVFLTDAAERKRMESRSAYQFIDEQVKSYQRQLQEAERRLKEFNVANRDGTAGAATSRIENIRSQIEELQLQIDEQGARVVSIQSQLRSEGQFMARRSKVDALVERVALMRQELDNLRLSYQETYPDIISLKQQIADLEAEITKAEGSDETWPQSGAGDVANPYYQDLKTRLAEAEVEQRTLQKRKAVMERMLKDEYARSERIAERGAELSELTRDYDVTRGVYEEMLERKEAARLSMTLDIEGQGVTYKIQEPAVFPRLPSGVQFWHLALLGPLLGIVLPIGMLVAFVVIDPRVRFTSALQQFLPDNVPLLGVVAHYNTPMAQRVLRADIVAYSWLALVSIAVYVALVVMILTGTV